MLIYKYIYIFGCATWHTGSVSRDGTRAPEVVARHLNHWTTRKVPVCQYLTSESVFLPYPPCPTGEAMQGPNRIKKKVVTPEKADSS